MSELNIFDRGPRILPQVESAQFLEQVFTNGATPCPKADCIFAGVLVNVMVDEVLVLREKVWLGRRLIIRPKNGCQLRVTREVPGDEIKGFSRNLYIRVDEDQDSAAGVTRTQIARSRRSHSIRGSDVSHVTAVDHLGRTVSGAIVHHQQLKIT